MIFFKYTLLPLQILYSIIIFVKNKLYDYKILSVYESNNTIISIGNLKYGGTGKTPLVKYIAQNLQKLGYKPGLVSRGYGGKFKETLRVDESTSVKQTGDEAQILSTLGLPFYIDKNRLRAVNKIINETDCNVIISDDGLQHYNMHRDIEILVIDGKRRFGNNLLFPAGPLRESRNRSKEVDFVVNNIHL